MKNIYEAIYKGQYSLNIKPCHEECLPDTSNEQRKGGEHQSTSPLVLCLGKIQLTQTQ